MQKTATRALPAISTTTDAFKHGYETAQRNDFVGWNIKHAPHEETVVQFLRDAIAIINSDTASGHDIDYETRWVAGLLAGWLRRQGGQS